jgi:hypothetical protein
MMLEALMAALTFSPLDVKPKRFPDTAEVRVIRTPEEWTDLTMDKPPAVDFNKNSVVVVFAGERPTGGWSVRITRVEQSGADCTVHYDVRRPPRGAMVTQVITHPYAVALVKGKCARVKGPQAASGTEK